MEAVIEQFFAFVERLGKIKYNRTYMVVYLALFLIIFKSFRFWFCIFSVEFNIIFWGLQVEDISFFETLGGVDTCEDYILQKLEGGEVSGELIKVPSSGCLAKAMKPAESDDKLVPNIPQGSDRHGGSDGISSQTDNCVIKVKFKYTFILLL